MSSITYFCTVKQSCNKTFLAYNDWFEHEKPAHGQLLHIFYCNNLDGCRAAFANEREFRMHFEEMHPAHALVVENYFHDPLFKRFWCGFCDRVIEAPEYSVAPEFFRAFHIENHLQGGLLEEGTYQVAQHPDNWVYIRVKRS